ncbi:cell division protein [Subtercola boreus]|uniref:Cell wall synthesis protein Wag31 n=1 Tax=Subtercola boreus TaxID=120213 RepID=A0A3E0VJW2_9MICO|nr:DivIVA domain-containing protein [Subtercola boreus]RFA09157.1 cell division protein [Subtercola boreus]TQL53828.1 DivIVA domain-containing protein [Subtercola boreus]
MPLTPEEVVNKRFSQTQFRAGYDQDEVDDFLDEVVVELRRLIAENEELRKGIVPSAAPAAAASEEAAPAEPAAEVSEETAVVETIDETPAPEPVAAAPAAAASSTVADPEDAASTTSLLQLARRLHDEHVKEGADKRAALIEEGQATANRLVAEAEAKQRTELAKLNQEKAGIEHRIDELRTFEKEYRQKLRGYIEGQLRDLDSSGESAPASSLQGFGA